MTSCRHRTKVPPRNEEAELRAMTFYLHLIDRSLIPVKLLYLRSISDEWLPTELTQIIGLLLWEAPTEYEKFYANEAPVIFDYFLNSIDTIGEQMQHLYTKCHLSTWKHTLKGRHKILKFGEAAITVNLCFEGRSKFDITDGELRWRDLDALFMCLLLMNMQLDLIKTKLQ